MLHESQGITTELCLFGIKIAFKFDLGLCCFIEPLLLIISVVVQLIVSEWWFGVCVYTVCVCVDVCVCWCVFQGEIQQLLIAPDPRAAADYCHTHIPDCDSALTYNSLSLDPVEVAHLHAFQCTLHSYSH